MREDPEARWMAVAFSRDGLISAVSPESEPITGYSSRDLANQPITGILGDATVFQLQEMMCRTRESGTWSGEILHTHRDGRILPAYAVLTTLTDAESPSASFLLVSTIGAPGAARAPEANLSEIGARLREFTHQLNNPLAVILGFTQLLMTSPQSTREVHTEMERLYSEIRRLVEIVQRLHKYAVGLQESAREDSLPMK